jgi:hypothetical protein
MPPAPRWKRVVGATGFALYLKRLSEVGVRSDDPQAVLNDRQIEALRIRAWELAAAEEDEESAIRELRERAGRHRRRLLHAAARVRMGGLTGENWTANRANRILLVAAGEVVAPPTRNETQFFDEVEHLNKLPVDKGFALLAAKEPQLRLLEDRLPSSAERRREGTLSADHDAPVLDEIWEGLRPLVGRESDASDPLLMTWAAHGVARIHLALRSGVTLDDD